MNPDGYFTTADLLDYEKASKKALILLNNLLNMFYKERPYKSFGCIMADRIKSLESINGKIHKKKLEKGTDFDIKLDLLDIAGLRVIFCDMDNTLVDSGELDREISNYDPDTFMREFEKSKLKKDNWDVKLIYDFIEFIARKCNNVCLIKDYIMFQKESGYQSIHVVIDVPIETKCYGFPDGIRHCPVEIQFRNYTQHLFDQCEHDVRYKKTNKNAEDFEKVFEKSKIFLKSVSDNALSEMRSDNRQYLFVRNF